MIILLKAIFIGILQGITEFLPISSSGHLVLFQHIFNIQQDNLILEVSVHFATLLSILVFFRIKLLNLIKNSFIEIKNKSQSKQNILFILYIIIGIIPAGLIGFLFNDFFESAFTNLMITGIMFIITSIVIFSTRFFDVNKTLNWKNALFIGIIQIFALMPGISRSGSTISAGIFCGIKKEQAADFSFFMAIPLIAGSFLKEMLDVDFSIDIYIIVASISAFIAGYFSIYILYKLLKSQLFYRFAYYLLPVGIITVILSFVL